MALDEAVAAHERREQASDAVHRSQEGRTLATAPYHQGKKAKDGDEQAEDDGDDACECASVAKRRAAG
jgi:hypothetical protein